MSSNCQYKWAIYVTIRGEEINTPYLQSIWFNKKKDCVNNYVSCIKNKGYDIPDSYGSKEYIVKRKAIA